MVFDIAGASNSSLGSRRSTCIQKRSRIGAKKSPSGRLARAPNTPTYTCLCRQSRSQAAKGKTRDQQSAVFVDAVKDMGCMEGEEIEPGTKQSDTLPRERLAFRPAEPKGRLPPQVQRKETQAGTPPPCSHTRWRTETEMGAPLVRLARASLKCRAAVCRTRGGKNGGRIPRWSCARPSCQSVARRTVADRGRGRGRKGR